MDDNNYTTGSWLGLVRHGAVVVLEAGTDPAILDHLWHFLGRQPTIHGLLHEVTEQFGTGLAGLPSFAILLHRERLHAILRGDITLAAHTGDGTELVSGRDVTTWSERSLPLPESLELTLADGPEPAMVLPVAEAVVLLQSLRLGGISPGSAAVDGLTDDAGLPAAVAAAATDVVDPSSVDESHAPVETDLGLTIRPDNSEDELDELGEHGDVGELGEVADLDEAGEHGELPGEGPAGGEPADAARDLAEDGFTTNYDFLFGATVAQNIQDAAVRLDGEGQQLAQGAAVAIVPPLPTQPPQAGNNAAARAATAAGEAASGSGMVEGSGMGDGSGTGASHGTGAAADADAGSFLIESVPWARPAPHPAPAQQAAQQQPAELPSEPEAQSNPAEAQSNPAEAQSNPAEAQYDPDHDGHTVLRGEPVRDSAPETEAILASRPPTGPMVLARVCPNGHANPPSFASCVSCGAAIVAEPRTVGRPRLGTMHISNGEVVELDHSLIIGRQPSVSRVMGQAMPRLVQVKSGNDDISRSHVEVRLEGWDVLLVDLKSTNGTILVREGQPPRRLGQGEEAILLNGDIAELGDGVTLLFDGLL